MPRCISHHQHAHNPQVALNETDPGRDKARAGLVMVNGGKLPRGLGVLAPAVHTRRRGLRGTYVRELGRFERVPRPVSHAARGAGENFAAVPAIRRPPQGRVTALGENWWSLAIRLLLQATDDWDANRSTRPRTTYTPGRTAGLGRYPTFAPIVKERPSPCNSVPNRCALATATPCVDAEVAREHCCGCCRTPPRVSTV